MGSFQVAGQTCKNFHVFKKHIALSIPLLAYVFHTILLFCEEEQRVQRCSGIQSRLGSIKMGGSKSKDSLASAKASPAARDKSKGLPPDVCVACITSSPKNL